VKLLYDENLSPSLVPVLADVYIRDLGLQAFLDGAHPKIIWIGLGKLFHTADRRVVEDALEPDRGVQLIRRRRPSQP
jgi:predicted nuclease of predicted toxin-antitoxin system